MGFSRDDRFAAEVGSAFGQYLITFESERRQVRADLFRNGRRVAAHVQFAPGIVASTVSDPYVTPLWDYARREGVADHFQLIMS